MLVLQNDDQSVQQDRGRLARLPVRDTSRAFKAREQGLRQRSVPLTPETKVSIDKEQLMKMPEKATLINMACLEEVLEAEMVEDSQCDNRRLLHLRRAST